MLALTLKVCWILLVLKSVVRFKDVDKLVSESSYMKLKLGYHGRQ
jgi:hypothetical protein